MVDKKQVRAGKQQWAQRTVYTGEAPQTEPLQMHETPYLESCRVYGHEPKCASYWDHLVKCRLEPDRKMP